MRPYDRYETAGALVDMHEAGTGQLSGVMTVWDQLDLSLYCSRTDRYNAQLRARAAVYRQNEAESRAEAYQRFNMLQQLRRAKLGPIQEPRKLGRKV